MLAGELYIPGQTSFRMSLTEDLSRGGQLRKFDIFISHYHEDLDVARKIAQVIRSVGCSAYLDLADPEVDGDSPELEIYLRTCIRQSAALYALISHQTRLSWWVPLEAGVALEQGKEVATTPLSPVAFTNYPSYFKKKQLILDPINSDALKNWALQVHYR